MALSARLGFPGASRHSGHTIRHATAFRPLRSEAPLLSQTIHSVMKKFSLLLLFTLAGCAAMSAQRFDYLTLRTTEGSEHSFPVDGLKFTIRDGNLVTTQAGSPLTIPLAALSGMRFTALPTGIASTGTAPKAYIRGGRLCVDAPAGTRISVSTIDGRSADPRSLAPGIYLVTINGKTQKLISR